MPNQKEKLKYALASTLIGIPLDFLIYQIYTEVPPWEMQIGTIALGLGAFLGVFLVLSFIGKPKKPSFSLIVPIFIVYFATLAAIALIQTVLFFNSISSLPYSTVTLSILILEWLQYCVPFIVFFILVGIVAGIMVVRLISKFKLDVVYFVLSSLLGVGAGLVVIQFSWTFTYSDPYFALSILIVHLAVAIIQVLRLRKRQTSEIQAYISVALWIIGFIALLFMFTWLFDGYFPPSPGIM